MLCIFPGMWAQMRAGKKNASTRESTRTKIDQQMLAKRLHDFDQLDIEYQVFSGEGMVGIQLDRGLVD